VAALLPTPRRQPHRGIGRVQGRQLRQCARREFQRALQVGADLPKGPRKSRGRRMGHPKISRRSCSGASHRKITPDPDTRLLPTSKSTTTGKPSRPYRRLKKQPASEKIGPTRASRRPSGPRRAMGHRRGTAHRSLTGLADTASPNTPTAKDRGPPSPDQTVP